jgi:hypothetical protein
VLYTASTHVAAQLLHPAQRKLFLQPQWFYFRQTDRGFSLDAHCLMGTGTICCERPQKPRLQRGGGVYTSMPNEKMEFLVSNVRMEDKRCI